MMHAKNQKLDRSENAAAGHRSLFYRLYRAIKIMEPTIGIEPMNLFLTKEALYRLSYVGTFVFGYSLLEGSVQPRTKLERETRLELATFSLEG
jgi:hypothetical protein